MGNGRMNVMLAVVATVMYTGTLVGAASEHPDPTRYKYTVLKERDTSFGHIRSRITVEVVAENTKTEEERVLTAMNAAVNTHRKSWPHAVSSRVWLSAEQDVLLARVVYAPDGCGWAGNRCEQGLWSETNATAGNPPYIVVDGGVRLGLGISKASIPDGLLEWGAPTEAEKHAAKDTTCRRDLECWASKHFAEATVKCQFFIENMARYDYEWTDGWFDSKFTRQTWKDHKAGVINFGGDKLKFQNAFGAWVRVAYWCAYDPATKEVKVEVFPYR